MSTDGMPYEYRDAWTSVVKTYEVVDAGSLKAAHYAKSADDKLDRRGTCRQEWPMFQARDDMSFEQVLARAEGLLTRPCTTGGELSDWLSMRNHPLWGFMVEAERQKWPPSRRRPYGDIPPDIFFEVVRAETRELRKMVRNNVPSAGAVSALATKWGRNK